MIRRSPRRRAERGSGPVTVVMVLAMLALIFTVGVTAIFAAAGGERSSATHAADAAALAGARGVLDQAPIDVAPGFTTPAEIPLLLGGGICVQTGRVDAFRLAAANGATLTSYCYNVYTDTVRASVRMNGTDRGRPATASAEAATTFQAASCVIDPGFSPPTIAPTPSPSPSPTTTPAPPPPPPPPPPGPVRTTIDCGFGNLTIVYNPSTSRFQFVNLAFELRNRDPRLTK